jgi:uncharacterized protein
MFVKKSKDQLDQKILVVLDKDQPLVSTLTEIVTREKILGGHVTGIGAIKDVELGFYHLHRRDYHRQTFSNGDFELIALNGNISLKDGAPYVHVHTAIGDDRFQVFGGHLFEAKVAVTAEIYISPFGSMPVRTINDQVGLATISRCEM